MVNNKKLYQPFKCLSWFDLSLPNYYFNLQSSSWISETAGFFKKYKLSPIAVKCFDQDCLNLFFDRRNWISTKKISKNVLISNLSLAMTCSWRKIIIKCHGITFSGIEKKTLLTFIKGRLSGWFFQKQINKTNVCNWSLQENENTPTML